MPNNFCRIAYYKCIRGNVVCHDAPCTNNSTFTYCNPRENTDLAANPYIIMDSNRQRFLYSQITLRNLKRMNRSIESTLWSYKDIITDRYFSLIQYN